MLISKEQQQRLLQQLQQANQLLQAHQQSSLPNSAQLEALVTQYNQQYKNCCEKMGWPLPTFLAEGNDKSTPPTQQEEIDCKTFSNAVLQWRIAMFKFFKKTQKEYSKVSINTQKFREEMALYKSTFPIVQALFQEWETVLGELPATTTGEELFAALLNNKQPTWQLTNDLKAIEQHYKKNKREYKPYQSTMESFRDEAMPKGQYFLDALSFAVDKEDSNLPENVEEAAVDKKEELKQMEKDYKEWLNETLKDLSEIDTTEEGQVISKDLLTAYRTKKMVAPPYAQAFWETTGKAIEKAILAEAGVVSCEKASELAADVLVRQFNEWIKQENKTFFEAAVTSQEAYLPYGLTSWLKASMKKSSPIYQQFLQQWQEWCQNSSNIVALGEHKKMGKTYTIDPKQLEKEMTQTFTYTVNGTSPGLHIWRQLQPQLPQERSNFDNFHKAWQNGIASLLQEDFVKQLWSQHLTAAQGNSSLEEAIVQFFLKAPSQEQLVNALWDARAASTPQPQFHAAARKNTLQATVTIPLRPVPLLLGKAAQQISDETGLTSLASMISSEIGGTGTLDTSGGIENLTVRLAKNLVINPHIPMQVIASKTHQQPIAVPMNINKDSILLTGQIDDYYAITIDTVQTNREEPQPVGNNKYQQTLLIKATLQASAMTVNIGAGAVVLGTGAELNKQPKESSLLLELLIESTYDPNNNSYQIQFSPTQIEAQDYGGIIRGMTLTENSKLTLPVYKK